MTELGSSTRAAMRERWDGSFREQIAGGAYNTAAVEALVRNVSYYLRDRFSVDALKTLHFLEMGCGTGPNLVWLAQKGIRVSGVDISPTALGLARENLLRAGCAARIERLVEGTVSDVPFESESFDGIVEACVFQHLGRVDRARAFGEVRRLLKPGGIFVGYMLDASHTVFQAKQAEQLADDPGTLVLAAGGSKVYLENIGVSHFFHRDEILRALEGFSVVDPCLTSYELPKSEARKRGYPEYLQSMWAVYAIK
jgi:SAM-dependent methyltransferase